MEAHQREIVKMDLSILKCIKSKKMSNITQYVFLILKITHISHHKIRIVNNILDKPFTRIMREYCQV